MTFHGFEQDRALQATKNSKFRRWFWRIVKIILVLMALAWVGLTVLSRIGGNGEQLKLSVEQFFDDNTKYEAHLRQLNTMEFFPEVIIDFEGLALYEPGKPNEAPPVTAEKVNMVAGFWDILRSNGSVRALTLSDVQFAPGVIIPKSVNVHSLNVIDEGEKEASLVVTGTIGDKPFNAKTSVAVSGEGARRTYKLGGERNMHAVLGDAEFFGNLRFNKSYHAQLEDVKIRYKGQDVATGNLAVRFRNKMDITGDLVLPGKGSKLKPDLIYDHGSSPVVKGKITSDVFYQDDVKRGSSLDMFLTSVAEMLGYDTFLKDLDITLEIANGYHGPLPIKDGHIDADALSKDAP